MQGAQRTRDYSFIDDTIAEMEGWASFQPKRDMGSQLDLLDALSGLTLPKQSPVKVSKVGRNEPCPCGSGKSIKNAAASNITKAKRRLRHKSLLNIAPELFSITVQTFSPFSHSPGALFFG